jgi:endonuclease I
MTRLGRAVAALLLAVPASAQVVGLSVAAPPLSSPAIVAPSALSASLVPGLGLASPLSAPASLSAAAAFSAPAAAVSAAPAVPSLAADAPAVAAPSLPAFAAPASEPQRARDGALTGAAAAARASTAPGAAPGRALFDGSWELRTRSGSVFVPSFSQEFSDFPGGFALVRIRPSPAAPKFSLSNAQGLYGEKLLQRVGEIAARGQSLNTYHAASKYLFSTADNHTLNGLAGVADAYSGVFIPGTSAEASDYSDSGERTQDGWHRAQTMNVEHVFPQTYFRGKKNAAAQTELENPMANLPMRSDLHHLMATLAHPNEMRGSLPFGVVEGKPDYRNSAGAKRGGGVFEPPDFSKGRVARAMLYFYARYRNEGFWGRRASRFWNSQVETMLDWNRRFPPTVEERRRNDQVELFQHNRNPFVDDPSLADKIGLEAWLVPMPRAASRAAARADAADAAGADSRRSDVARKSKRRQAVIRPQQARYRPPPRNRGR